ncbi:hypothetical protein [Halostagnicola kamekurae]|uniref:hypothetical protein n=1 Tax=Halostagnicola kamekurae TaxID=619731 RepID=UPI0011140602|nr:hypothetical protein [Halostagnicola kamekurae]
MSTGRPVHRGSSTLESATALEDCSSHGPTAVDRTGRVAAGLFARAVDGVYSETGAAGGSGDDGCRRSPAVFTVQARTLPAL